MSKTPIDAVAELNSLDADRGPADLRDTKRRLPRGARVFGMLLMLVSLLIAGGAIWLAMPKGPTETVPTGSISRVVESLRPPSQVPAPAPAPTPHASVQTVPAPSGDLLALPDLSGMGNLDLYGVMPDMVKQRRLTSPLNGAQAQGTQPEPEPVSHQESLPLHAPAFARRLESLQLPPSRASLLENRDMLITQGTSIDCVLMTRIVSTQPGMFTCQAPVDVYSTSGRVKLIDAGSKFVGYQQSGFAQGQDRIFAVWTRMESPSGVIINLDSPGTGPLGESGFGGYVDHHFWDRFGNAIMISLIGDLGTWASNRSSDSNSIRLDNTQDGASSTISKVLEHTVDIPPTLYKNQGERIAIMVARDLDFSDVYDLKLISPR